MNKLSIHTTDFHDMPITESESTISEDSSELFHRLIVLVPPGTDCTSLTRRICKLAKETTSDILLLGLTGDLSQELEVKRDLIMVSAMIRDSRIYVEMKVEIGTDWLAAIKPIYQNGDAIVCVSDPSIGIRHKLLSQILKSTFRAPIYVLSNAKPMQNSTSLLSQVFAWSGLIAIIVLFFFLQSSLIGMPDTWEKTVLLILLLIPELLAIVFWNSLF